MGREARPINKNLVSGSVITGRTVQKHIKQVSNEVGKGYSYM